MTFTPHVDSMSCTVGEVPGKRTILKTQSQIPYVSQRLWHRFGPKQNVWSQTEFIEATYFSRCATWLPPSFLSLSFPHIPSAKHSRPEHGYINHILTRLL